jgi:hypothetical protein
VAQVSVRISPGAFIGLKPWRKRVHRRCGLSSETWSTTSRALTSGRLRGVIHMREVVMPASLPDNVGPDSMWFVGAADPNVPGTAFSYQSWRIFDPAC